MGKCGQEGSFFYLLAIHRWKVFRAVGFGWTAGKGRVVCLDVPFKGKRLNPRKSPLEKQKTGSKEKPPVEVREEEQKAEDGSASFCARLANEEVGVSCWPITTFGQSRQREVTSDLRISIVQKVVGHRHVMCKANSGIVRLYRRSV